MDLITKMFTPLSPIVLKNCLTLLSHLMACSLSYVIIKLHFILKIGHLPFLTAAKEGQGMRGPRLWIPARAGITKMETLPSSAARAVLCQPDCCGCWQIHTAYISPFSGLTRCCFNSFPPCVGRMVTCHGFRTAMGFQNLMCIKVT